MKAIWNDKIITKSDDIVNVEGNACFPVESVKKEDSDTHTVCPWKGTTSYYNLEIDGKVNKDAVWYYPEPSKAAKASPTGLLS
jgi:uncharacterized protein (DUF427 family)